MRKLLKYFVIILVCLIIIPQIASASVWDYFPFKSFKNLYNNIFTGKSVDGNKDSEKKGGNPLCAMDVKKCLDGSYVKRSGPKCEFEDCKNIRLTWKLYENKKGGFEFRYPRNWILQDENNKNETPKSNIEVKYDPRVDGKFFPQTFCTKNLKDKRCHVYKLAQGINAYIDWSYENTKYVNVIIYLENGDRVTLLIKKYIIIREDSKKQIFDILSTFKTIRFQ